MLKSSRLTDYGYARPLRSSLGVLQMPQMIPNLSFWLKSGVPGSGGTWGADQVNAPVAALNNTTWGSNFVTFNGTDSYAQIAKGSDTNFSNTDNFSCVFIFDWDSSISSYNALCSNETISTGFTLLLKSNQKTAFYLSPAGNFDGLGVTIPFNTKTMLAITYDGTNIKSYVNGTLDVTKAISGSYGVTDDLRIGASKRYGRYFKGNIYDVLFYRSAITASDITLLKNHFNF